MLMFTHEQASDGIALRLEGRVAGPWTHELARFWAQTAQRVPSRKLSIDLRDVTYADFQALKVLRTIYSQTCADLLSSGTGRRQKAYRRQQVGRRSA